ncbi:hypothetical protein HID58_059162, partial [Brassica napus]
ATTILDQPKVRVFVIFSPEDSLTMSSSKEQPSEQPSLLPSLPDDIIIDILSRVRWCDYRTLSLVSKHFRSLIASHALYARRSFLGCTERRLYVALSNGVTTYHNPYILCLKANGGNHRLVLIPWPTNVPHVGSFANVGSKIYAFDTLNRYHHLPIPSVDCRFQTVHLVSCMNATMDVSVAGVIDGKIYVTGYTKTQWDTAAKMVMAVFDAETQIWETATETIIGRPYGCVVMAGKMYRRDARNSFVYDPKESKWETDKRLNMFKWEAYDPRKSSWVVVKGLERLVAEGRFSESYYTGSCGGKLISLERRHHGRSEIWGKIDWCDDVLFRSDDLFVTKTLDDSLRMSSKTRSTKEESSEPPSLIPSLPEDIIVDILARVGRCYYPKLSLVSKHFRSLVTSHELYARRSLLGCTEHSLYVVLCNKENDNHYCYVLYRKANGNHSLVLIPSLPKMPRRGGFVAVGSRIYVFVADIIDGKIYVTGYCNNPTKMVMPVFDTETEMWEPKKTTPETMSGYLWARECVVMAGKMYMRDPSYSFVYDPKERKWETDKMLNKFKWRNARVVDDILYYFDYRCRSKKEQSSEPPSLIPSLPEEIIVDILARVGRCYYPKLSLVVDDVLYYYDSVSEFHLHILSLNIHTYDPKESSWLVVNGLKELLAEARYSVWSYTGSYGGKLAMFFPKTTGRTKAIRCAETSLERRRQGKEIWGKVEWCDDVLVGDDFYVKKSLDVICRPKLLRGLKPVRKCGILT